MQRRRIPLLGAIAMTRCSAACKGAPSPGAVLEVGAVPYCGRRQPPPRLEVRLDCHGSIPLQQTTTCIPVPASGQPQAAISRSPEPSGITVRQSQSSQRASRREQRMEVDALGEEISTNGTRRMKPLTNPRVASWSWTRSRLVTGWPWRLCPSTRLPPSLARSASRLRTASHTLFALLHLIRTTLRQRVAAGSATTHGTTARTALGSPTRLVSNLR